jgi:hypothetical protein
MLEIEGGGGGTATAVGAGMSEMATMAPTASPTASGTFTEGGGGAGTGAALNSTPSTASGRIAAGVGGRQGVPICGCSRAGWRGEAVVGVSTTLLSSRAFPACLEGGCCRHVKFSVHFGIRAPGRRPIRAVVEPEAAGPASSADTGTWTLDS